MLNIHAILGFLQKKKEKCKHMLYDSRTSKASAWNVFPCTTSEPWAERTEWEQIQVWITSFRAGRNLLIQSVKVLVLANFNVVCKYKVVSGNVNAVVKRKTHFQLVCVYCTSEWLSTFLSLRPWSTSPPVAADGSLLSRIACCCNTQQQRATLLHQLCSQAVSLHVASILKAISLKNN